MEYLTIEEIKKLTGKSEATIRRLVKRLYNDKESVRKQLIKKQKSNNGFSFIYLVDKQFLLNNIGYSKFGGSYSQDTYSMPIQNDTLTILKDQLELLKKQLEIKDLQISQLMERDRETNILLKNFQETLKLPLPKKEINNNIKKEEKKETKKKKKKSWWSL
jgi:hypothetical protein